MKIRKYDVPVVFFVEVEYEDGPVDYLTEREKVRKSLAEQLGYAIGDFDFIYDAVAECISGCINSIQVQK